jgi:hypothetical protein
MPTTIRDDPYPGHNVQVVVTEISNNGKAVSGALSEISGLEVSIEAIPYRNGNEDITVRKVPGAEDVHEPDLQARRDRPRGVLELDQGRPAPRSSRRPRTRGR